MCTVAAVALKPSPNVVGLTEIGRDDEARIDLAAGSRQGEDAELIISGASVTREVLSSVSLCSFFAG